MSDDFDNLRPSSSPHPALDGLPLSTNFGPQQEMSTPASHIASEHGQASHLATPQHLSIGILQQRQCHDLATLEQLPSDDFSMDDLFAEDRSLFGVDFKHQAYQPLLKSYERDADLTPQDGELWGVSYTAGENVLGLSGLEGFEHWINDPRSGAFHTSSAPSNATKDRSDFSSSLPCTDDIGEDTYSSGSGSLSTVNSFFGESHPTVLNVAGGD